MPEPGDDRSRPWEDQRPWKGHFPNLGRGGFNYWLRPPDPYCLELAPTQVASTPAIHFHTGCRRRQDDNQLPRPLHVVVFSSVGSASAMPGRAGGALGRRGSDYLVAVMVDVHLLAPPINQGAPVYLHASIPNFSSNGWSGFPREGSATPPVRALKNLALPGFSPGPTAARDRNSPATSSRSDNLAEQGRSTMLPTAEPGQFMLRGV